VRRSGPDRVNALLWATFAQCAVITALIVPAHILVQGVLAPLGGHLLRRMRPDLPRVVASDYAGAGLVVVAGLCVLGLGLSHRPAVAAARKAFQAQSSAVRSYILSSAPVVYRRNLAHADTWKLDTNLYRTCVPGHTAMESLCLFVDTSQAPPGLRRDPNPVSNARYFGPHGLRPAG